MAENDVTIQIKVEAKDAQAAIELFGKESVRVLQKTESQADSFFSSFAKAKGTLVAAIGAITAAYYTMSSAIGQAVEDAKLTRQIEASLRATDEASKAAVDGVLEFADALKAATGISDDLVKQTFITAKSFGVTTDQAKELTKAAIDLAAATGVDVETAVRQLGGTLDGSIGKIGNLGKEFRNLTSDQLKAGDAIGLVNEKFGGTASKELDTYQGSINSLKNAWDDFLKIIGKTVVNSDIAKNAIAGLASVIDSFNVSVTNTKDTTENLDKSIGVLYALGASSSQIEKAVNASLKAQESFNQLGSSIGKQSKEIEQGFAGIVNQAQGSTSAMADFEERLSSFPDAVIPPLQKTGKELEELKNKAKKLAEEAQKFKEGIFGDFGSQVEKEASKAQQALLKVQEFEKQGALSAKDAYDLRLKIALDFNQKQIESAKRAADEEKKTYEEVLASAKAANDQIRAEFEKQQVFLKSVFENPFGNLADKLGAQIARAVEFAKSGIDIGSPFKEGEIAASISGGLALALQGKAGATKAISGIAETIGASFGIPGLGAITELLSQGPEATKKFITEFIKSIPDIIQAISESIPVVVEALVDTLVNKGGALRIGIAIAKAMAGQPVFAKLSEEIFGKSGEELGKAVTDGVTEYSSSAQDAFTQFFTEIGPAFGRTFESLGRDLENSFEGFDDRFNSAINSFAVSFSGAITDFINAIGPAFSQFFNEIGPAFEIAFGGLITGIVDGISNVFMPIENALLGLADMIRQFADSITPQNIGGSGGGKGVISEFLGLAKGGIVYAAQGTLAKGTDTVPAMLTPGELVVPRDMVSELGAYLSAQRDTSGASNTAMLASILSEVQKPIVVQAEAKVNQSAFADIILQLNRQNARLTA